MTETLRRYTLTVEIDFYATDNEEAQKLSDGVDNTIPNHNSRVIKLDLTPMGK